MGITLLQSNFGHKHVTNVRDLRCFEKAGPGVGSDTEPKYPKVGHSMQFVSIDKMRFENSKS